jgi:hypothetical protein
MGRLSIGGGPDRVGVQSLMGIASMMAEGGYGQHYDP